MVSQLQRVSSADIYYICQMIDGVTRDPDAYIRNVEDIFGDMSSLSLVRRYPKWTCFHDFIEAVISDVIFEDAEKSESAPGMLWVDYLIRSNGINYSDVSPSSFGQCDYFEYLDALQREGIIAEVCEEVSRQVFHVLFSNRGTLSAFGRMLSGYVLETAPSFAPDSFSKAGHLIRASIPSWVRSAVFHRDKGRCVSCRADLTNYFSQRSKINFDHIVPLARGGMNCITNLQLMCSTCNQNKGAQSAATSLEYEVWYDC